MELQNQTPNQQIEFTQSNNAILHLIAVDQSGNPVDLTGATMSTQILGPNPIGPVIFGNGQHTIDPDQNANRGKFIITLSQANTLACGEGLNKEILSTATIASVATTFRGVGILNVYIAVPLQ